MNISGPLPVSGVNAPQHELDLHPFQRVTAQVLSITGTTALLSIEGYPIVAQLASADQAATLLPQQTAQFIVTQRTNQNITLKIVNDDQTQANLHRSVAQGPELAVRLLEQQNIPVTANHLVIARAMLKKHLPVTPALLNEVSDVLSAYGSWGSKEADLAAALKAAGLPLSPQSLQLASRQALQIGDSLARLISKLTDMKGRDLPEDLLKQLNSNLQMLNFMILKAEGESFQLARQLKAIIDTFGKSLENSVLEQAQTFEHLSESNLLQLIRLQQGLQQAGENELAHAISDFLKDLQWSQFLNVNPDPILSHGEWAELGFAAQGIGQKPGEKLSSARLRIARDPGSSAGEINPAYTRLILQVDLNPDQTVEVDLSVVDKQIRTSVTAPDAIWCQQAQEELPVLEQALQRLGFALKDTQINVGKAHPFEHLKISSNPPLMTVDIEA
jgi:hypothetical protein